MGKEKGVKPVPGSEAYGQPELPSDIPALSAGGRTDDDLRFLLQSDDKDPDPWDYDDYGDRDLDDDDDYLDDDDDFEDENEDLLDIVERRSWSKPEMSRTLSEKAEGADEAEEESEALVPVVSGVPALTQKTAAPVMAPPPPVVPAAKASQSIAKPAKITAGNSIRKNAVKTARAVKTKPSTLKVAKVSARKVSKKVATKKAAVKKAAPKAPAKKAVKAPAKKAVKKPVKKAVKKAVKKPVKKAAKKPVKKAAKK